MCNMRKIKKCGWIDLVKLPTERSTIQMYAVDTVIRINAVWRELDWVVLTTQLIN